MAFTKLVVELGGLCMLVIRDTGPAAGRGLYVLMPNHLSHDEVHCPHFVAEEKHTRSGRVEKAPLRLATKSDEVDLRFMASHAATATKLPAFVANVSRFYGRNPRAVKEDCYEGAAVRGLAARVILPLPEAITPKGEKAEFLVPGDNLGEFVPVTLYGSCQIEYSVHTNIDSLWNERVKGVDLQPDPDDTIAMYFVNARPKDYHGRRFKHDAGELWTHQQAYHDLIQNGSTSTGPRAILRGSYDGEDDIPLGEDCRDVRINSWPPRSVSAQDMLEAMFIDPYTCTLGGGCPQGAC